MDHRGRSAQIGAGAAAGAACERHSAAGRPQVRPWDCNELCRLTMQHGRKLCALPALRLCQKGFLAGGQWDKPLKPLFRARCDTCAASQCAVAALVALGVNVQQYALVYTHARAMQDSNSYWTMYCLSRPSAAEHCSVHNVCQYFGLSISAMLHSIYHSHAIRCVAGCCWLAGRRG